MCKLTVTETVLFLPESQLESLAQLAAHVHLSTLCVLDQTQPHLSSLLLSPATFIQCLTMTHTIATSLLNKEKVHLLQQMIHVMYTV